MVGKLKNGAGSSQIICKIILVLLLAPTALAAQTLSAPEQTVKRFYAALKKRDRKTARKYAAPAVVRKVFRQYGKNINWYFNDCEVPKIKTYGDVACFYYFSGGGIGIFLREKTKGRFLIVSTYEMTED